MKLILLLLSALSLNAQSISIDTVRVAYKDAAQDKSKVEVLYQSIAKVTKQDHVVLVAYKGAVMALFAKQQKTIKAKKDGFIEGVSFVEYAIEKAPNTIETRFIRLTIQENTPKLLRYKKNIEEDKHFILTQFKNIKSSHLKNHIKDYISQSKVFSDEEKSVILSF